MHQTAAQPRDCVWLPVTSPSPLPPPPPHHYKPQESSKRRAETSNIYIRQKKVVHKDRFTQKIPVSSTTAPNINAINAKPTLSSSPSFATAPIPSSLPESGNLFRAATMQDLNFSDRQRILNLVQELAKVEIQKKDLEVVLDEERTHRSEMQSNLTRTSSQLEKCKLEIQVLGSRLQEAIVHPTRISEDLPHETDVSDQVLDKISQKLNGDLSRLSGLVTTLSHQIPKVSPVTSPSSPIHKRSMGTSPVRPAVSKPKRPPVEGISRMQAILQRLVQGEQVDLASSISVDATTATSLLHEAPTYSKADQTLLKDLEVLLSSEFKPERRKIPRPVSDTDDDEEEYDEACESQVSTETTRRLEKAKERLKAAQVKSSVRRETEIIAPSHSKPTGKGRLRTLHHPKPLSPPEDFSQMQSRVFGFIPLSSSTTTSNFQTPVISGKRYPHTISELLDSGLNHAVAPASESGSSHSSKTHPRARLISDESSISSIISHAPPPAPKVPRHMSPLPSSSQAPPNQETKSLENLDLRSRSGSGAVSRLISMPVSGSSGSADGSYLFPTDTSMHRSLLAIVDELEAEQKSKTATTTAAIVARNINKSSVVEILAEQKARKIGTDERKARKGTIQPPQFCGAGSEGTDSTRIDVESILKVIAGLET